MAESVDTDFPISPSTLPLSANVTPDEMLTALTVLYAHAQKVFPEAFRPERAAPCPYCYNEEALNMYIVGKTEERVTVLHVDPPCKAFKVQSADDFIEGAAKELAAMRAN